MKKIVLFVLDGAADRKAKELKGLTPLEYAKTPGLDRLARKSSLGLLAPRKDLLGASTDLTHFLFLGYPEEFYPGRSVLEAASMGIKIDKTFTYFSALLAGTKEKDGKMLLVREKIDIQEPDAKELFDSIPQVYLGFYEFKLLHQKGRYGILQVNGPRTKGVTDVDPFKDEYPVNTPEPEEDFRDHIFSMALKDYLIKVRNILKSHPVNVRRKKLNKVPADTLVIKWQSYLKEPLPAFKEITGLKGAIVATQSFFKGMANILKMDFFKLQGESPTEKVKMAIETAETLLFKNDFDFVLINVKDLDEASHLKDPFLKVKVIEEIDSGFEALFSTNLLNTDSVVFCLTADHPTPSKSALIHSGEPTPLLIHSENFGVDTVRKFNESSASKGRLPLIYAEQLLALLLNAADRIAYSGSKMSKGFRIGFFLPEEVKPFSFEEADLNP